MLHTKLLLHRLARVPWLLAASLVLGWSGMAAAQTSATISLTAAPTVISEDAGATDVVLTATLDMGRCSARTWSCPWSLVEMGIRRHARCGL